MNLRNVGIREMERHSNQHFCDEGRGGGAGVMRGDSEGFRTLSRVDDHRLLVRETDASSRFEWNNLLNESRRIPEFDSVERRGSSSREHINGRNYDRLVEISLLTDVERDKNLTNYATNFRFSEHRESASDVTGLPNLDSGNLEVTVREYPPHMERETVRQPYNEGIEGNDVVFSLYDGFRSLTPRSQSSGQKTPIRENHMASLEGLRHNVHHRRADGFASGSPCIKHNSLIPRACHSSEQTRFEAILAESLECLQQEVYPRRGDGFDSGGIISSSRDNNYHRGPYSSATGTAQPFPAEAGRSWRVQYNPDEDRSSSYIHKESQRTRTLSRDRYEDMQDVQEYRDQEDAFGINAEVPGLSRRYHSGDPNVIPRSLSRDIYEKNQDTVYYYDVEDVNGNNVEDPALHRRHYTRYLDGSVLQEIGLQLAVQPLPEAFSLGNYNQSRANYEMGCEYDREILNANVGQTSDDNYETLHYEEHYGRPTDSHGMLCRERNLNIPTLDERDLILDDRGQQYGGLATSKRPNKLLKRKHSFGKDAGPSFRNISYHDTPHGSANVGTSKPEDGQSFGGLSVALQRRLSKPHESGRGDVKKRLKHHHVLANSHVPHLPWWKKNAENRVKPSPNVIHKTSDFLNFGKAKGISSTKKLKSARFRPSPNVIHTASDVQNFGKAKGISSNKKLKSAPKTALCPSAAPDSHVLHSGYNVKKPQKLTDKELGITKEAPCSQTADPDHSILKVKPADKDPPEDSEDFRRQVDMWFLKSMEHLNANIDRHRKFKEHTKGGTLKCIICSSSTEFPDTKGVAMHALTSLKVGYRAPHSGFHKALCVLMGWDSGAVTQNGRWTCQSLAEVEAWTLKEDIIIWPPVCIIHNSSARNYSHNELTKVPTEQLQIILKGMGFSDGNTKLCHGKPGNVNVMVVKFSGTLSGLKEAERLHNMFAERKHGRAELQKIDVGRDCCEGVDQKSEDKIQDQLYGYLGTIEDLDKLNYGMKRHCRARSKKEILASVDSAF